MENPRSTSNRAIPLLACGITGVAGGVVLMFAVHASIVFGPLLGAVYGVLFALVFWNRAQDPGSGLLWGLAYAFLLWLAVGCIPRVPENCRAVSEMYWIGSRRS